MVASEPGKNACITVAHSVGAGAVDWVRGAGAKVTDGFGEMVGLGAGVGFEDTGGGRGVGVGFEVKFEVAMGAAEFTGRVDGGGPGGGGGRCDEAAGFCGGGGGGGRTTAMGGGDRLRNGGFCESDATRVATDTEPELALIVETPNVDTGRASYALKAGLALVTTRAFWVLKTRPLPCRCR